ncbi:MAG: DUF255 domain-containing protein [Saprospiraceae bacterium]|nr:DUF255 domain-containing protein [Saprospiraceae bacterium]
MKNTLLSLITFSVILIAFAFTSPAFNFSDSMPGKNVKWMSWQQAVNAAEKAKAEGKTPKKVFVDIYTDWCGWCKKMDAETFEAPAVSAYLNKHFYPVKFNAEQKQEIEFGGKTFKFIANGRRGYHELAAALLAGKMSYPTVVFLNGDFQLVQRIPGYLNIETFDMIMHYLAEDHYTNTSWADYQKKYQKQQKNTSSTSNKN